MFCGEPPETSILFSFPLTLKPMDRLSGDQNGCAAPSVPSNCCVAVDPICLTKRPVSLALVEATKATKRPSGEIDTKYAFGMIGVLMKNRISSGGGVPRKYRRVGTAIAMMISAAIASKTHDNFSRLRLCRATGAGTPICELPEVSH